MRAPTEKHALRLLHRHFPRAIIKFNVCDLVAINNSKRHGRIAIFRVHHARSPVTGKPTKHYVICESRQGSSPVWFGDEPEAAMSHYMSMLARKKP